MPATYKQTATATYRYNVKNAAGKICCRGQRLSDLCADCQTTATACTCATCRSERSPHTKPEAAAPRAAARETIPPAPSVTAAVLAMRNIKPAGEPEQLANNPKNGIPDAPSLAATILAMRAREESK